jgi:Kef-type K+ transport system membrane component KefB
MPPSTMPDCGSWFRASSGQGDINDSVLIAACTLAFCSAVASEYVGLGYVIGAFLVGVAMPSEVRATLLRRLDWPATLLLMPFFYMVTGLRTEADLLSSTMIWLVVAATVCAMAGKIAGVAIPAMLSGESWRRSFALGTLLQSKGLMEVLVITILMDAGIVTSKVFSAVILVAVICTLATMPLTWLVLGGGRTRDIAIGLQAHPR